MATNYNNIQNSVEPQSKPPQSDSTIKSNCYGNSLISLDKTILGARQNDIRASLN